MDVVNKVKVLTIVVYNSPHMAGHPFKDSRRHRVKAQNRDSVVKVPSRAVGA